MKNSENKIQEMQIIEHNLHNLLLQKQAFQMELSETESALEEIKNSSDEVYKIIGQLMIKSEKSKLNDELENKKKIIDLRLKSLEKQEEIFAEKLEKLKRELIKEKDKS
ncbi:MAG: prefoldin subunit [Nanoarchaeota archaeon]|nr:prefoldin subunit [Nanoarchaeota archaeon]